MLNECVTRTSTHHIMKCFIDKVTANQLWKSEIKKFLYECSIWTISQWFSFNRKIKSLSYPLHFHLFFSQKGHIGIWERLFDRNTEALYNTCIWDAGCLESDWLSLFWNLANQAFGSIRMTERLKCQLEFH